MSAKIERRDDLESPVLRGRPFVLLIVASFVFIGAVMGLMALVFRLATGDHSGHPVETAPAPQPDLHADPTLQLKALRAAQQARLSGYHWVDRDRGLVAVPIERAMTIVAARGADAYAPIVTLHAPLPATEPQRKGAP